MTDDKTPAGLTAMVPVDDLVSVLEFCTDLAIDAGLIDPPKGEDGVDRHVRLLRLASPGDLADCLERLWQAIPGSSEETGRA